MDFNSGAYVGFWTNWSRGPVLGATLTLPNHYGTVLVSAITIFIQVSGTFSWMVLSYLLHQWRIKEGENDLDSDQQQIVLRNVGSDFGVLWQIPRIGQLSKRIVPRAHRRAIPLTALAAIHLVLFIAAGIFSSEVTSTGTETLVKSRNCGYMNPRLNASATDRDYENAAVDSARNADVSMHQVRTCNVGAPSVNSQCDVFAGQISLDKQYNATCPFHDPEMCISPDGLAIKLDTGMLDSQSHFGMNSPRKDRVQFRQVVTCSPVKQDGFRRDGVNATGLNMLPGDKLSLYDYGPLSFPYQRSTRAIVNSFSHTAYGGYYLSAMTSTYPSPSGNYTWRPVSNLTTKNSELTLIFSQYVGTYLGEINDPLFSAHHRDPTPTGLNNIASFLPDDPASVLGCAYQYQLCNNNARPAQCSPLMGLNDLIGVLNDEPFINGNKGILGLSKVQFAIANRFIYSVEDSTVFKISESLGGRLLLANDMRVGTSSIPLPNNQWQLEVINMHDVMMTAMQRKVVEYATGPTADLEDTLNRPEGPIGKAQCGNQIIRRDDYMNFSVLAVTSILVVGIIFLTAFLFLEPLNRRYQARSDSGRLRNLRWDKDELLELHQTACQVQERPQFSKEYSSAPQSTVIAEASDLQIPGEYEDSRKNVYTTKSKAGPFIVTTFI